MEQEQRDTEVSKLKLLFKKLRACDVQSELRPKQQRELVVMSLSIQQVALQASSVIKHSLQVSCLIVKGVDICVAFAEFRENRGSREKTRRKVCIRETRDWVLPKEESCDLILRT